MSTIETERNLGEGLHAWQDHETAKWLVSYTVQSSGREVVRGTFNYQSDAEAFARSGALLASNVALRAALAALVEWMDASGQSFSKPVGVGTAFETKPVEFSVVTNARAALAEGGAM